jgi:ATP-dependent helicase/nuclease subunit A
MIDGKALLDDEKARERIREDLDTTFLVEAGAGSGKTTSIVDRMLALVRTGRAEAREIAAITFTNKAAAELSGRFRLKLEEEADKASDREERERLEEALRQAAECYIGTIHAFCGRLLRERPIEAGVDPEFREMDETEDREFRDRCWDEYLEMLRMRGDVQAIEELAALQVNVEDLWTVYCRVSEYEDVEIYTDASVERPDFDRIRESLFPLVEEAYAFIPKVQPEKGWDALQEIVRTAVRHLHTKEMADDMNVLTLAKLFDRSLHVTFNRWTDPKEAKRIKERFLDWQAAVLQPFLREWREFVHPKVIAFVRPAAAYCRQKRMEAGKLNFQDLLMRAAELLRTSPEVRAYFSRRYRRLFVDEFQDTDPIQAEMMLLLTGADETETDWRKQLPRPGSLFVVGDPKQSIYRFRRADISTYNFVKQRILACGDVLQLTRNFRSVHAIGDFVNAAFAEKFAPPEEPSVVQAPYVRMVTVQPNPGDVPVREGESNLTDGTSSGNPARPHPNDGLAMRALHGVYTLTVPKQDWDRQTDIAAYDAEHAAQFIAWACRDGNLLIRERADRTGVRAPKLRPARPSDFLILLKFRKFIHLYAEQLEKYGIPADTSGSLAVFEELRALHQLAAALGDPDDRIPLLAVLRGMLFGLSDDELYHYRREGGRISLFSNVDESGLSEKGAKVQHTLARLRQYRDWTVSMPALSAFTRIVDDLGLIPAAAVKESGALRSGTLLKLLEVLQGDPEASRDWPALTARLLDLAEQDGLEAAGLFAGSGDAVRIMNLHKAKGLEAPVVLMACPCGNLDHDASEHIDRMHEPPQGYFAISKPRDAYTTEIVAQPPGWDALAAREREFMNAETDRLLYVAATRAKQLLIVSRYPSKPLIDPWSRLAESLEEARELERHPVEPAEPEPMRDAPDVEACLAARDAGLSAAARPSYRIASVTGLAHSSSSVTVERSATGRGMAYGSLVHRALQAIGEGLDDADLPAFIRMAAEEAGVDEQWLEQAEAAIRQVTASELWRRAMRAARRYHEFSFLIARQDTEADGLNEANASADTTMLLRGVIDLVFEEPDGWVIVDFKTDQYELDQEQQFVDLYKPQVLAYVDEWQRTVGGKVKEAGLYFVGKQRYVVV